MTRFRALILLGLALPAAMLALACARPAAADDPPAGLTMEAKAAFDGNFKYGEWLPIWVDLENDGSDLKGEIQVRLAGGWGTAVFAAPADLPSGSHKRIPVYVLPNNYSHELEARLVSENKTLFSLPVLVTPRLNTTYLVGLVAPQRGALGLLAAVQLSSDQPRAMQLVDLLPADLPERPEGLRSLDCLIFNDIDTESLTPQQKAALETWVRQGGRLVIGGGAGAMRTAAGLPASLLPFVPRTVTEVDALPGLADWVNADPIRVPGPFIVASGDISADGQTLAAQDGLPLVRERTVGSGTVDFVALDLTASPFDAWGGTSAFWERLISPGAAYPSWLPPDMSLRQMRSGSLYYALSNLPSLDLPSVQSLAVLLGIYILLVGPVNYLVLRWRKKLQWAWITTPLLTIAFTAGAFGLGYLQRGNDLILNKIAIVQLQPDGAAGVSTYLGLFSPAQQSYEIRVTGGPLLSPLNPESDPWRSSSSYSPSTSGEVIFLQGNPGLVRGLAVSQWSMQAFSAEGEWANFGQISGDFWLDGANPKKLVGVVGNKTQYKLADAVLILGNAFVRLGDLAPGQEVSATLSLADALSTPFGPPVVYRLFEKELSQARPNGPPREVQLKQTVLENTLQPGGWSVDPTGSRMGSPAQGAGLKRLLLVGWIDQAPPELQVSGRTPAQQTTAVVLTALPYRLPDEGWVVLPPGLVGGTLVKLPTEGGQCGSGGSTAVYIGRGRAVLEFQLPEELRGMKVEELELALNTDGGWLQPVGVAVYDWSADQWLELQNQSMGTNIISSAGKLVSLGADGGLVRVQLSSDTGGGGCYYVEMGFSGTR